MDLDCVLHVQQRIFQGDDAAPPSGLVPDCTTTTSALRSLLFTPIAGDGTLNISSTLPDAELNGLRFGMLDAATVVKLSVAVITNPACVEHPGCLSDLPSDSFVEGSVNGRMGASAITNRPCETCHASHHNQATCHNGCLQQTVPGISDAYTSPTPSSTPCLLGFWWPSYRPYVCIVNGSVSHPTT